MKNKLTVLITGMLLALLVAQPASAGDNRAILFKSYTGQPARDGNLMVDLNRHEPPTLDQMERDGRRARYREALRRKVAWIEKNGNNGRQESK